MCTRKNGRKLFFPSQLQQINFLLYYFAAFRAAKRIFRKAKIGLRFWCALHCARYMLISAKDVCTPSRAVCSYVKDGSFQEIICALYSSSIQPCMMNHDKSHRRCFTITSKERKAILEALASCTLHDILNASLRS